VTKRPHGFYHNVSRWNDHFVSCLKSWKKLFENRASLRLEHIFNSEISDSEIDQLDEKYNLNVINNNNNIVYLASQAIYKNDKSSHYYYTNWLRKPIITICPYSIKYILLNVV